MENKETITRESHYEYGENGELTRLTINETITNPHYDDAQPVAGEVEFFEEGPSLAYAALALVNFCLGVTALVAALRRH